MVCVTQVWDEKDAQAERELERQQRQAQEAAKQAALQAQVHSLLRQPFASALLYMQLLHSLRRSHVLPESTLPLHYLEQLTWMGWTGRVVGCLAEGSAQSI